MMGIFASIKNAIWHSERDEAEEKAKPAAAPTPVTRAPAAQVPTAKPSPTPAAPATPDPISEAAMAERISRMPRADSHNWRTSIVDLMTMVGIDPSFENRKELADELGLENYTGTAEQNMALHHAVLNLLAAEGGQMPGMLRD